jgi:hypothetical protein
MTTKQEGAADYLSRIVLLGLGYRVDRDPGPYPERISEKLREEYDSGLDKTGPRWERLEDEDTEE